MLRTQTLELDFPGLISPHNCCMALGNLFNLFLFSKKSINYKVPNLVQCVVHSKLSINSIIVTIILRYTEGT